MQTNSQIEGLYYFFKMRIASSFILFIVFSLYLQMRSTEATLRYILMTCEYLPPI